MRKRNKNPHLSIGVEIDKNKVIVTELTEGVITDVISVTLDTLEESWKEATKNYKKYMKKNLFTVSLSNYFAVYNDVYLNYNSLESGNNFKNIVAMQTNSFVREEIFSAGIAEKNSVLPNSDSAARSIVTGYNSASLEDIVELLKNTRAQIIPTPILLGNLNENILYTGFDTCFFVQNKPTKNVINLRTGGVCANIQNLCLNSAESKAIDRFLDVIDGSIEDIEAVAAVAGIIDKVADEMHHLAVGARDSFVLTGILGANADVRSSIESKGVNLDSSIYEKPVWGEVSLNDRSEFLVSLLAATNNSFLPRHCLLAESDLLYSGSTKKERKKNVKTHTLGVTLVLAGVAAGFYPLFTTQNSIDRAQEVSLRLENRLNETLEFENYFVENKEELEFINNVNTSSYSYETVKNLTESLPSGVTLSGFRYENSSSEPFIVIDAYGFSSTGTLNEWVASLESREEVSQVWVDIYSGGELSAQYSVGVVMHGEEDSDYLSDGGVVANE